MTIEQHNKALGIMHLIYGGINELMLLGMTVFFSFAMLVNPEVGLSEPSVLALIGLIFGLLNLLFVVPPLLAGYALLKRKSWARMAGIVSAALAVLNFPHGTALSAYTFWFLFSEGGRRYQDDWSPEYRYALNDAPPPPAHDWINQPDRQSSRQPEHVPPAQPPDWRG